MARYLLVEVDENERAARLREKLDGVEGLVVIGVFGKPTKFCECEVDSGRSILGKKFGWWVCPTCRHPKFDALHNCVKNLLDMPDLPTEFRTVYLGIREPFRSPVERTGLKIIRIKMRMIDENWAKLQRRKKRHPRMRRNKG